MHVLDFDNASQNFFFLTKDSVMCILIGRSFGLMAYQLLMVI